MINEKGKELALTSAQAPELRQLERRPNESEQAHAARMAFCRLPSGQRSIAGVLERIADAGRPSHIVAADKHEKQGGVRYSVKDKPAPGSCTAPTAGTGSNRAP